MMSALQLAALILIAALLAALSFIQFAWGEAIGFDASVAAMKAVVSAVTVILMVFGLILAGDGSYLKTGVWRWARNRLFQSRIGLWLIIATCFTGLTLLGAASLRYRTVTVSADLPIVLINSDVPGRLHDIGEIEADSEQKVLMRTGDRLLAYRVLGTDRTGALAPLHVPSILSGTAAPIRIQTEKIYEPLESPVRVDPAAPRRN